MCAIADAVYVLAFEHNRTNAPVGFTPSELELFDLVDDVESIRLPLKQDHNLILVRVNNDDYVVCSSKQVQDVMFHTASLLPTKH